VLDFESWQGKDFFHLHVVKTGSMDHQTFYSMSTGGIFRGIKRLEADHPPPISADLKNTRIYISTSPYAFTLHTEVWLILELLAYRICVNLYTDSYSQSVSPSYCIPCVTICSVLIRYLPCIPVTIPALTQQISSWCSKFEYQCT
jgi:hypothetical protein